MSLYLILDLAVLFFPLALSFDRRVAYVRSWPAVLAAAALVGIPFLVWDAFMTQAGAWAFSERWAGAARIAGLPPAEILFFVAVPFACVFLYEVVGAYFHEPRARPRRLPWLLLGLALGGAAIIARGRLYTSTILGATALFLLLAGWRSPGLLASSRFWWSMLLTYVPFVVMNGVLTALPIVSYSPLAILGPRVYTIPVEDFIYSFTLLGVNLFVYDAIRGRAALRAPTGAG